MRVRVNSVILDFTTPSIASGVHTIRVVLRSASSITYCRVYVDGVESVTGELNTGGDDPLNIGYIGQLTSLNYAEMQVYEMYVKDTLTDTYLVNYKITGFSSIETDTSPNGNVGTWSGTGIHTSIIPALSDKSADALNQDLVYRQRGRNLIPHTYLSMPEDVYELYAADQEERYGPNIVVNGTFDTDIELYSVTAAGAASVSVSVTVEISAGFTPSTPCTQTNCS